MLHIHALSIAICKGGDSAVQRVGAQTRYFKIFDQLYCQLFFDNFEEEDLDDMDTIDAVFLPYIEHINPMFILNYEVDKVRKFLSILLEKAQEINMKAQLYQLWL